MNPLFRIDFSISDSLKIVRKSVLIYETIINSFENKEQVSVVNRVISGGRDFVYRAPAHSVNVLIMKKQSAYE